MKKQSSNIISLRALTLAALVACVVTTSLSANAYYDSNDGAIGSIGGIGGIGGDGGYGYEHGGRSEGDYGRQDGRQDGRHNGRSRRGDLHDYREVQRLVDLIYQAALFRYADPTGLQAFSRVVLERGAQGLYDSARMIGTSPELAQLVRSEGSQRVVYNIYRVFFNRLPDYSGLYTWSRMLDEGRGGDALYGIVSSQEFYQTQM